jgi:hypothetical protein
MEKEMETLQRDLKVIEDSYGNEVLNLVLAWGYLSELFNHARLCDISASTTAISSGNFRRLSIAHHSKADRLTVRPGNDPEP